MAKRYFSFVELETVRGKFKPAGTLGSHHCLVGKQGKKLIVYGSVSGCVTLQKGDTLGYDCGTIWKVPAPESYKDPIRRILAKAKVSQRTLEFSDKPVQYTISASKCLAQSCADTSTGEFVSPEEIFGNGRDCEVPGTFHASPDHGEWQGGFSVTHEVTGGEAVIVRQVNDFSLTTCRETRISRIVVRPSASKAEVANFIEECLTPEGQARRRAREEREVIEKAAKEAAEKEAAEKFYLEQVRPAWKKFLYAGCEPLVWVPSRQYQEVEGSVYRVSFDRAWPGENRGLFVSGRVHPEDLTRLHRNGTLHRILQKIKELTAEAERLGVTAS